MNTDKLTGNTSPSEIDAYFALGEFWDTHSLADYWDETEPAQLEFAPVLGRRVLVPVDSDLLLRVQRSVINNMPSSSPEALARIPIDKHLAG